MKKNKGFTLIELLAVIVILAVIALIATPIIMNVINDAKKGAAKDAMYGYVKAVELASAASFDASNVPNGTYQTQNGNLKKDSETLNINFKGTKPKDGGEVVLNYGTVTSATLEFNGFQVTYKDGEATVGKEGSETDESNEPKSFAEDSWDTILEAVKSGKTDYYHVGDTKEVDLGSLGKHTLRIANMSNNAPECTNPSYSKSACGFVLEFADIITTYAMNQNGTNEGGWPDSEMRTYINETIYQALPSLLRNTVIDTKTVSGHGSVESENFITTDKLYLLSAKEVLGNGVETNNDIDGKGGDSATQETRQLDYYKELGVTKENYSGAVKASTSGNTSWWLRSAYSAINMHFLHITHYGSLNSDDAMYSYGVSPAFRIG